MTLCFAQYGDASIRSRHGRALAAMDECWLRLRKPPGGSGALTECVRLLRSVDSRLGLEPGTGHLAWVVTYEELPARGLAELAAERALGIPVGVGRAQRPLDEVLREVRTETGYDASRARVRVGFTRGHALEVVVALEPGATERQTVAEWLVEALLGEALTDDWVAAVDTMPLARPGPLRVLQTEAEASVTYPLAELRGMVELAVDAVSNLLPDLPRCRYPVGADWSLLEMEADPERAQPDRVSAATWLPELLKGALEGSPFHSRRFSKCGERFAWLGVAANRGAERAQRRENLERELDGALRRAGHGALFGTGFGPQQDYFDLCLGPEDAALGIVFEVLRGLGRGGEAELGFYDSRWAEERLRIT